MSTKPKLYLSGPMSDMPALNHPAFNAMTERLRAAGYHVISPAENGLPPDAPWVAHMRVDIPAMLLCDAVATLPRWNKSKGANLEVGLAISLLMPVKSAEQWLLDATQAVAA